MTGKSGERGAKVRITRLFSDTSGESHFEDVEVVSDVVTLGVAATTSVVTPDLPVESMVLRDVLDEGNSNGTWHTYGTPRFLLMAKGGCEIEASDGEIRQFRAGDLLFCQDTAGKGHVFRPLPGPRSTIFLKVPEGWQLPRADHDEA